MRGDVLHVLPLLKKRIRYMYYPAAQEGTSTASESFTITAKRALAYRVVK
jgi:hypothetical protein